MAVEIKLPTVLRVQADGQATVAIDGAPRWSSVIPACGATCSTTRAASTSS